jgi:hypothetical protein
VSQLHQHRRVESQHVVQVAEGVEWRLCSVGEGSTAMVVKRNTRNEGNTHRIPVVPCVQPLLNYAPSYRFEPQGRTTGALRHTTLNAACSWTALITTVSHSWSSVSSSQSHKSSSQSPHSLFRPHPAEGLASHSCEARLSQGHPHTLVTIRPAAANSAEGGTPPRRSTPFDGLGSHKSLEVG